MEDKTCSECTYYQKHYTLIDGQLLQVNCGHCTKSLKKKTKPNTKICDRFIPGTSSKEEMVSKQYLTKSLLHKVLSLELFPENVN